MLEGRHIILEESRPQGELQRQAQPAEQTDQTQDAEQTEETEQAPQP